jgi:hypothetical protein
LLFRVGRRSKMKREITIMKRITSRIKMRIRIILAL